MITLIHFIPQNILSVKKLFSLHGGMSSNVQAVCNGLGRL